MSWINLLEKVSAKIWQTNESSIFVGTQIWAIPVSMEMGELWWFVFLLNKHSSWKWKFISVSITRKKKKKSEKRKHGMQIIYQVKIELINMGNSLPKLQSILNFLILLKLYSRRLEHQVLGIEPIPLQYIK